MSSPENPLAARHLPPPIEPMRRRERLNPFAWLAWLLLLAALCLALWWAYVTGHLDRLQAVVQSGRTTTQQDTASGEGAPPDVLPDSQPPPAPARAAQMPTTPPAMQPAPVQSVQSVQPDSNASAAADSAAAGTTPAPNQPTPAPPPAPVIAAPTAPAPASFEGNRGTRRADVASDARTDARRARKEPMPSASANSDVQVLSRMPPRYPASALLPGGGTTVLQVEVSRYGVPTSSRLVQRSGSPVLDRAAMAAVAKWRFRPSVRDGQALAGTIEVPIAFPPSGR